MPKRTGPLSDGQSADLDIAADIKFVAEAVRRVSWAIAEHIIALRSVKSLVDPDDEAARHILAAARLNLPANPRMARAATAAGFTALGRSRINDNRPLLDLADRVRRGEPVTPASAKAAELAADYPEHPVNNIATRLRQKYRKDETFDWLVKYALARGASLDDVAAELHPSSGRIGSWRADRSPSAKKNTRAKA